MENHQLGTHNDKMCSKSSTENTPNTQNLFDPFAQIGQSFGIFLVNALITCPMSMFNMKVLAQLANAT